MVIHPTGQVPCFLQIIASTAECADEVLEVLASKFKVGEMPFKGVNKTVVFKSATYANDMAAIAAARVLTEVLGGFAEKFNPAFYQPNVAKLKAAIEIDADDTLFFDGFSERLLAYQANRDGINISIYFVDHEIAPITEMINTSVSIH